jgi:hypothetical protein
MVGAAGKAEGHDVADRFEVRRCRCGNEDGGVALSDGGTVVVFRPAR